VADRVRRLCVEAESPDDRGAMLHPASDWTTIMNGTKHSNRTAASSIPRVMKSTACKRPHSCPADDASIRCRTAVAWCRMRSRDAADGCRTEALAAAPVRGGGTRSVAAAGSEVTCASDEELSGTAFTGVLPVPGDLGAVAGHR
jgi:hypothetical protein